MVHSPSKKFENGVLLKRAISTNTAGDPIEDDDFVSGSKPYKAPEPTRPRLGVKRIAQSENKAVTAASKKASKS